MSIDSVTTFREVHLCQTFDKGKWRLVCSSSVEYRFIVSGSLLSKSKQQNVIHSKKKINFSITHKVIIVMKFYENDTIKM